jgi:hypothetical protein
MTPDANIEFKDYTPEERQELYRTNPELFDKLAAEAIREACNAETPEESLMLRRLQWTIDSQLRKAKSQPERLMMMENIFYSHVFGSDGNLAHMVEACLDVVQTAHGVEHGPSGKPELVLVKR